MKKFDISKRFGKFGLMLKKNSPEILLGAGIFGVVTGAVLMCRSTLKANDILEESKKEIENYPTPEEGDEELKKGYDKEIKKIKAKAKLNIVKTYIPAVTVEALSIVSIISSNREIKKRNLSLASAYAALDETYKRYRRNVIEKYGEDVDTELLHDIRKETIESKETDENGKTKKVKKTFNIAEGLSEYGVVLDRSNKSIFNPQDMGYTRMVLNAEQNYCNDILRIRKWLTLNEVYKRLGLEPTKAGTVVGWIMEDNNKEGDNFIEFKVTQTYRQNEVGNFEEVLLVDFNVDGYIYDRIK